MESVSNKTMVVCRKIFIGYNVIVAICGYIKTVMICLNLISYVYLQILQGKTIICMQFKLVHSTTRTIHVFLLYIIKEEDAMS